MARKKGQRRVTQSSAKGGGFSTGWMVLLVVGLVLVGAAAFLLGRGSGQPETTATRPTSAASGPVTVKTNDPGQPEARLTVKSNWVP
jgi:hypothetical protein